MKKTPLISVVVLVLSSKSTALKRCLDSIYLSTGIEYELLLIVNSHDKRITRTLTRKHSQATVLSMGKNSGVSGFNLGIKKSRAPYVLLLDEDCEIEKNSLHEFVKSLQRSSKSTGAIAGNVYNTSQQKNFYQKLPRLGNSMVTFPGGATAFKKEIFQRVGYFDEDFFLWLHEDDFAIRMIDQGYEVGFDKNIIIKHSDVESSFRPMQAMLIFRNKAWLNLKHFSFFVLPFLMIRDIVWIVSFSFYKRKFAAFWFALTGYVSGLRDFRIIIYKRHQVRWILQLQLLWYYFSFRNR